MWKVLSSRWKYLTARMAKRFDEKADPRVQLEQAIAEARERHHRLKDHATTVIANQKQTEMQLHRALSDLQRVNANARSAVLMAEEASVEGDLDKVASLTQAAEQFSDRIINLEQEIENLKILHSQVTAAAEQAKAAIKQSDLNLQAKHRERQQLLSQLDQARFQERMNDAMSHTLPDAEGEEVPSFDQVRSKIEVRYAKAKGAAELASGETSDTVMLEIESEVRSHDAKTRLNKIKDQLGIATDPLSEISPADTVPQLTTGTETDPKPDEPAPMTASDTVSEPASAGSDPGSADGEDRGDADTKKKADD